MKAKIFGILLAIAVEAAALLTTYLQHRLYKHRNRKNACAA